MKELSDKAADAVDDLLEIILSRQITEEHGDELCLQFEFFGFSLSDPFGDQFVKVHCCENLRKQLTEQTLRF